MIERITSLQNPRVKKAIRLHSSRGRQTQGRIIVFGTREVGRAIDGGVDFEELYFADSESDELINSFKLRTERTSPHLIRLDDPVFDKVSYGDRNDGAIGVALRPQTNLDNVGLDELIEQNSALVIVVQSIEKPGNLGAIIRTADACGVSAVICADPMTDCFHPNSIRSSTGAVFKMPLATTSTEQVQQLLQEKEFRVFTAMLKNANDFYLSELTGNVAIVLGNEANGLDDRWNKDSFTAVKLPMMGIADSLNVSVSASVMIYEAMRQRGLRLS